MRELFAFFGARLVGQFRETGPSQALFEYAPVAGATPLSLSLPLMGEHGPGAAWSFLDNLLPDNDDVRHRWARERNLDSVDPFTLLAAYGEDVAGALSLTTDPDLPRRVRAPLVRATDDDVAARIGALGRDRTSWTDPQARTRMSLAGMQGKFTLARIDDHWFWPTYEYPSTHILKPPAREHPGIDLLEHVGLELARSVGVEASRSASVEFRTLPTFIVERWDRQDGIRLHAEDLNQSLGNPTSKKYAVTAPRIARLLDQHGEVERFIRQLAFNVAFGNADAHAKNYSVLLAGDQIALAPIYDTVPVYLWAGKYDTRFSMPVGKARHPAELTERNWRLFADQSELDPDLVCGEALPVVRAVAERLQDAMSGADLSPAQERLVGKQARALRQALPAAPT